MLFAWLFALSILLALTGTATALSIALFRWFKKPADGKAGRHLVGVPLGCGFAPLVLLGSLLGISWLVQTMQPASSLFEEALGTKPTTAISNLKASVQPGFDSRAVYLAFDRSDAAWSEVMRISGNRVSRPHTDLIDSDVFLGNAPVWWHAGSPNFDKLGCRNRKMHSLTDINGWNDLVFIDCVSDGRIYVLAHTID